MEGDNFRRQNAEVRRSRWITPCRRGLSRPRREISASMPRRGISRNKVWRETGVDGLGCLAEVETAEPLEHTAIAFGLDGEAVLQAAKGDAELGPSAAEFGTVGGAELFGREAEVVAYFLLGSANGGESVNEGVFVFGVFCHNNSIAGH